MLNVCKYCVFKVINLPAPQTLPSYVGPIPGTLPIVHGEGRPPPGLHQISPSLSASVHPPPPYYQAAGDMTVTERLSNVFSRLLCQQYAGVILSKSRCLALHQFSILVDVSSVFSMGCENPRTALMQRTGTSTATWT